MQEAWIQLVCPACDAEWEASVRDLPAPGEQFQCDQCRGYAPTAEFTKTARDLEVLRNMT
jgi:hypothetical protein